MESATASVMMTMGAVTDIGASMMSKCPASPMAVRLDSVITPKVARVPMKLRSTRSVAMSRIRYMAGMRVVASVRPASAKALLSIDTPVSATLTPGYCASISAAICRATATAAGTSVSLSSGYCSTTLTAVAKRSRASRFP